MEVKLQSFILNFHKQNLASVYSDCPFKYCAKGYSRVCAENKLASEELYEVFGYTKAQQSSEVRPNIDNAAL